MEKHLLSKSTFIRGSQCLKSLYLHKHRNFLRDPLSAVQLAKFTRGTEVGVYARNLFPGGVNCQPKSPSQYRKAVEQTRQLIESGTADVIYEAAFQYDRVLVLLDILVKENGTWKAYEVKSSLKLSETYLADAALQYYVLTHAGINLADFSLVHINPEYQRNGGLEIRHLFNIESVLTTVQQKQNWVHDLIGREKETLEAKHSPRTDIGEYCHHPYPCDFIGHCWKHIRTGTVFDMSSFSTAEKFGFYQEGQILLNDVADEKLALTGQKAEATALRTGKEYIDFEKLATFLNRTNHLFRFVHFLGRQTAIPLFSGYKPYDIEPVAVSLCTDNLHHGINENWLNKGENRPSDDEVIGFLDQHTGEGDTLVMFDATRFKDFLAQAARRNPGLKTVAERLTRNILDLREAFTGLLYVHPALRGNFELNNIAGKLLEKHIRKLTRISSDIVAAGEFEKLRQAKNTAEKERLTEALKNYSTYNVKAVRELYRFLHLKLMD